MFGRIFNYMGSFHLKSRKKSISQLCEERKSIEKKKYFKREVSHVRMDNLWMNVIFSFLLIFSQTYLQRTYIALKIREK